MTRYKDSTQQKEYRKPLKDWENGLLKRSCMLPAIGATEWTSDGKKGLPAPFKERPMNQTRDFCKLLVISWCYTYKFCIHRNEWLQYAVLTLGRKRSFLRRKYFLQCLTHSCHKTWQKLSTLNNSTQIDMTQIYNYYKREI